LACKFLCDKRLQSTQTGGDLQGNNDHKSLFNIKLRISQKAFEGTEKGGKAGLLVWSLGGAVSGKFESSTSTVSRIRFSVAVELPKGNQPPPRQQHASND
jgi:hypothetical protein